jgi:hypothetical protein
MTDGSIDITTVYGGIAALSSPQPWKAFPWAVQNIAFLTAILPSADRLFIAPPPAIRERPGPLLGRALKELSFATTTKGPKGPQERRANSDSAAWIAAHTATVRSGYRTLQSDPSFNAWIEWNIDNVWAEHCARLTGLADPLSLVAISEVSRHSSDSIFEINRAAATPSSLSKLVSGDTTERQIAVDIYVLSILLRGIYYDALAKCRASHLAPHQVRSVVLPELDGESQRFVQTNSEAFFSALLVAAAYRPKSTEGRITAWARAIRDARVAIERKEITLTDSPGKDSLDVAVKAAQTIRLDLTPKWVDVALAVAVGTGANVVTSFVLTGWMSLAASSGATAGGFLPLRSVRRRITNSRNRLRSIAGAGPGRITRTWYGGIRKRSA